jgi:hypothetical protein
LGLLFLTDEIIRPDKLVSQACGYASEKMYGIAEIQLYCRPLYPCGHAGNI